MRDTLVRCHLTVIGRHFNLLEILLAMVVIVVGVVGIMSMIPGAQKSNEASFAQMNVTDAGDQFVEVLVAELKTDWDLTTAFPVSRPLEDDSQANWVALEDAGLIKEIPGITIRFNDLNGNGELDYKESPRDRSGLFLLTQETGDINDFKTVVRIWRQSASYRVFDSATGRWTHRAVDPSSGIQLNLELSYPADIPYAARRKAHFAIDVFRPKDNEVHGYGFAGALNKLGKTSSIALANTPPRLRVDGSIRLSMNNSGNVQEFYVQTPSGQITRDTLKTWVDQRFTGENGNYTYYDGPALVVYAQPRAQDSTLTLHGDPAVHGFKDAALTTLPGQAYHFTGSPMTIKIYQYPAPSGHNPRPTMTNWWIEIVSPDAVVSVVK